MMPVSDLETSAVKSSESCEKYSEWPRKSCSGVQAETTLVML